MTLVGPTLCLYPPPCPTAPNSVSVRLLADLFPRCVPIVFCTLPAVPSSERPAVRKSRVSSSVLRLLSVVGAGTGTDLFPVVQAFVVVLEHGSTPLFARIVVDLRAGDEARNELLPEGKASARAWEKGVVVQSVVLFCALAAASLVATMVLTAVQAVSGCHGVDGRKSSCGSMGIVASEGNESHGRKMV